MEFVAEEIKKSLYPPDIMDYSGLVVIGIIIFLATLAGTAGNSQLFTIILLFFRLPTEEAVAQTCLFGLVSSAGRLTYELISGRKNPSTKRINFHIVLISAPWIVIGTFIGVNISNFTPESVRFGTIMLLFTYMSYLSLKKLITKCKHEAKEKQETGHPLLTNPQTKATSRKNSDDEIDCDIGVEVPGEEDKATQKEQENNQLIFKNSQPLSTGSGENDYSPYGSHVLDFESDKYIQMQTNTIDKLSFLMIILASPLISVLRGVDTIPSIIGIKHCSKEDIGVIVISLAVLVWISLINTCRIMERNKRAIISKKQINFTFKAAVSIMVSSLVIGTLGSWLGVAVSTMSNLYLLNLGLSPFVGGPTSLAIVFLTSGSSSMLFFLEGIVDIPAFLMCSVIIVGISLVTRLTIYKVMMKSKKASIPVLFVLLITVVSIPGIVYKMLPPILENISEGISIFDFKFASVCK